MTDADVLALREALQILMRAAQEADDVDDTILIMAGIKAEDALDNTAEAAERIKAEIEKPWREALNDAANELRECGSNALAYHIETVLANTAQAAADAEARLLAPWREALADTHRVLAALGRQASDPGPDRYVKVTAETWLTAIRPTVEKARALLATTEAER